MGGPRPKACLLAGLHHLRRRLRKAAVAVGGLLGQLRRSFLTAPLQLRKLRLRRLKLHRTGAPVAIRHLRLQGPRSSIQTLILGKEGAARGGPL